MKWLNEEAIDVLVHYYYPRAKWLQLNCNWGKLPYEGPDADREVNDPLMQAIDIYDCYTRNAAGFSNVLQDLKFRSETPKRHHQINNPSLGLKHWYLCDNYVTDKWDLKTWFFAYMAHRATGSGASFTRDHGYRNNCVHMWGTMESIDEMISDIKERKANKIPTFTSIGNQPPAPRKGVSVTDYITEELPGLLDNLIDWLHTGQKKTHKQVVDYLNEYNLSQGHKRDMSHGYFGNNAVRCMQKLSSGYTTDAFMDILCERMGGAPRDNEDVLCDFVRFGQNYVPRSDDTFDHVSSDITNNSGWVSGWEQRQGRPPEKSPLEELMNEMG
jgi:hypothetical protein